MIAFLFALLMGTAQAATPAFSSAAQGGTIVATSFTMSLSYSGYAFVITSDAGNTDASSVTDNGGSTFTKKITISNGTPHKLNIWTNFAAQATTATTTTVTYGASGVAHAGIIGHYTGVTTECVTKTATGNSTTPSISDTLCVGNDFLVAGLLESSTFSQSANTGTLRQHRNETSTLDIALVDNTNAAAVSVTDSTTIAFAEQWAAASIVLSSQAASTNTFTPTATATKSGTSTPTATVTATVTATATISGTNTATASITRTATVTDTVTATRTGTASSTSTVTATATATISGTSTTSGTATVTATASNTSVFTLTNSGTSTRSGTVTATATISPTSTVSATATATASPTARGSCN